MLPMVQPTGPDWRLLSGLPIAPFVVVIFTALIVYMVVFSPKSSSATIPALTGGIITILTLTLRGGEEKK